MPIAKTASTSKELRRIQDVLEQELNQKFSSPEAEFLATLNALRDALKDLLQELTSE